MYIIYCLRVEEFSEQVKNIRTLFIATALVNIFLFSSSDVEYLRYSLSPVFVNDKNFKDFSLFKMRVSHPKLLNNLKLSVWIVAQKLSVTGSNLQLIQFFCLLADSIVNDRSKVWDYR